MKRTLRLGFFCLTLLFAQNLMAQPMGSSHTVPISIVETGGVNQSKFQARFIFDTEAEVLAGHMNADGSDIRMSTDCIGSDTVQFFIENHMNTDTTVFWVLVDGLNANDTMDLFMSFGDPSATTMSNVDIFNGPHSSTDSVVSPSTNSVVSNSSRGFIFTPQTDILVHHFGKREPTGTTRFVTLWDVSSQTIIHQDTVPGGSGSYYYRELDTSMWLAPGTNYILSLFQGQGDGYYYGTSSQSGSHITYGGSMRYCNSCTENTYPTSTLTNYHYGTPDFWYYIKDLPTSAPTVNVGTTQGRMMANAGSDTTVCANGYMLNGSISGGSGTFDYLWTPGAGLSDSTIAMPMATFSGTASYALSATDSYGCVSNIDTVNLMASAPLMVSLGADTSFCDGGSVTLSNSGSMGMYMWSTGDTTPTITVSTSGDYSVVVTDSLGCDGTDTVNVAVAPAPAPAFTASANLLIVSFTDNTVGASTWAWDFGDGNTSSQPNPSNIYAAAGTYVVCLTVTDAMGCTGTTCDTLDVIAVGMQNALSPETIVVFPNPFTGVAKIKVTLPAAAEGSLSLTDIYGKQVVAVSEQVFAAGRHEFELSSETLAAGVYFLNLSTDLGKVTKKVIIK